MDHEYKVKDMTHEKNSLLSDAVVEDLVYAGIESKSTLTDVLKLK